MNTPEQIFRLQTQLSTWSGTKKIAEWLVVFACVLCVIGVVLYFIGEEKSVRSTVAPLSVVVICALLRREAKEKIRSIEAKLSS